MEPLVELGVPKMQCLSKFENFFKLDHQSRICTYPKKVGAIRLGAPGGLLAVLVDVVVEKV